MKVWKNYFAPWVLITFGATLMVGIVIWIIWVDVNNIKF